MAAGICATNYNNNISSRFLLEEDLQSSPTDVSEDSIEVHPILALSKKNKRKLAEPRKVPFNVKIKRPRIKYSTVSTDNETAINPFRPWSETKNDEPLSLVLRQTEHTTATCGAKSTTIGTVAEKRTKSNKFNVESLLANNGVNNKCEMLPVSNIRNSNINSSQRNYKNMTRERRIEANARERSRVHTISAAFDTLRKAIPSYSNSQKLSKLSILRIACSYIVTLSRVNGNDYSAEQNSPSIAECVEQVSRTLHAEGKVRKKKDD